MTVTATRPPSPEAMSIEDLLAHIEGNYQVACRRACRSWSNSRGRSSGCTMACPMRRWALPTRWSMSALELDMHMQLEEDVLFCAMRQHIDSVITHPIALMRGEHAEYSAELDRVRELAHGFVPPAPPADHGGGSIRVSRKSAQPCASKCGSRTRCCFRASKSARRAASARMVEGAWHDHLRAAGQGLDRPANPRLRLPALFPRARRSTPPSPWSRGSARSRACGTFHRPSVRSNGTCMNFSGAISPPSSRASC